MDVLRGGNISYVPTCRPAHAGLSPARGSPGRLAGAWGWAASHAALQRGCEDAKPRCPFPAAFTSTRGRPWPLASFGWSPSTLHQLSSTMWTVKSGLKVFKCLEPQRQKGNLNKWGSPPWHTSQLWGYKRSFLLSWTGAEKWHNTEGIGHRGVGVTLEMIQILLLILSTWQNVWKLAREH